MAATAEEIIAVQGRLGQDRAVFDGHWGEINEVIFPQGAQFLSSQVAGAKVHQKVYDSTGEQANDTFAAGMHALLTNPATKWFALRVEDEALNDDEEVARWLDDTRDRLMAAFAAPATGFNQEVHKVFKDEGAYGTASMFVRELPNGTPQFQARPLTQVFIVENDRGRIDTVYLRLSLQAHQAAARWGPQAGAKAWTAAKDPKRMFDRFEYIHCVRPRSERDPRRRDAANLPFESAWVSVEDKTVVERDGFSELPYVVPRWDTRAGETYGRGPGMKALADVKMLQRSMKIQIRGVEKVVDPPLMMLHDSTMSPVTVKASGVNHVRREMMGARRPAIEPLLTGGRPDIAEEFMAGVRFRIEAAFHKPLMQLLRDPRMTATHVLALEEEQLRMISPFLGRQNTELLEPLVDRVFGIMWRGGRLLPPPPQLSGARLRVQFESPTARAQRLSEARAVATTTEIMAPYIQADPSVLDNQDLDATWRHVARLVGQPAELMRPSKDVTAMRQARAQAAEEQARVETAEKLGTAAGRAAPALQAIQGGRDAA